jgi:hypothetical protein
MNNQQFRRLFDSKNGGSTSPPSKSQSASLGTKKSSFIPMTPRAVKGGIDVDFARQVRERNASQQPSKKFKSAAPRGVKYAAGYTDRAKARAEADDAEDDKAQRIQALEEQMKLGQISQEMFESLRDQITGGDISSTHLVKGLDRQLLERVRRGEDVMATGDSASHDAPSPDVDDELEKLEDQDVETVTREKAQKKGNMAPPPPVAGVKRSRDEIMAELKAQRKAAAEAKATPALDARKWRKVGEQRSRIELDSKGRQVLITVDEDGVVKKKVRKAPAGGALQQEAALTMPDASKDVLGADAIVPEVAPPPQEPVDEDDDIFEGVGTEYNPLGDDDEDDGDDSSSDEELEDKRQTSINDATNDEVSNEKEPGQVSDNSADEQIEPSGSTQAQPQAPRNYFKDTPSAQTEDAEDRLAGVQNFLQKAAKLDANRSVEMDDGDEERKARTKKHAEMLAQRDRDLEDMDMGFGENRYDDAEEDGEGKRVRLSEWKGGAEEGWDEGEKKDGKKKRKPKKRKGDANNMADIMRVIDGRKAAK